MNNIEFKTTIFGLQEVAPPVPAGQMIPDWFKNLSMHIEIPEKKPFPLMGKIIEKFSNHTIKKCPAVVDYFTEGYIIPLWSDVLIQRYGQDFHFESNLLDQLPNFIEFHSEEQFKGYHFKKNDYRRAIKFEALGIFIHLKVGLHYLYHHFYTLIMTLLYFQEL